MKIIVDAYNVLHQVVEDDHVHEHERKHFINQLAAYAKDKGHEIIVVFDGGLSSFATSMQYKGITVKYSGPKDSADDIIMHYVTEHKGHSMLLVSSDRELCQAARYYDVEVLQSKDFYDLLVGHSKVVFKRKQVGQAIKTGKSGGFIDVLMQQVDVQKKVDDTEDLLNDRLSPSCKPPKKERKRMQKLKKL